MKRILLKISWESLKWEKQFWMDSNMMEKMAELIKEIVEKGIELAIVVGWWNIYRGWDLIKTWVAPADSHNLSMLSTVFNGVVLKNFLEKKWVYSVVMNCNWVDFVEKYAKDKAINYLKEKKVVIFTWWTWNPYFSTDTGWVLRSLEVQADFMIKATRVDGVFDSDPEKNPNALMFEKISYDEVIEKQLKVMDLPAIILAKDNNLSLKVVNINNKEAILKTISWNTIWTEIY